MTARPDREGGEQLGLLGAAWEQLAQRSRAYLEALRTLIDVLETAERDTEF